MTSKDFTVRSFGLYAAEITRLARLQSALRERDDYPWNKSELIRELIRKADIKDIERRVKK